MREHYLAAVRTAVVDQVRQCNNVVAVDVVPSASTKAGVIPGTLERRQVSAQFTRPIILEDTYPSATGGPLLDGLLRGSRSSGGRAENSSEGEEKSGEAGHV